MSKFANAEAEAIFRPSITPVTAVLVGTGTVSE
jgi:hypothetical protein